MKDRKKGFTLIELLAVMGIMLIMTGLVVSSYFGMMRGSAMRTAVSQLMSTLRYARQTAIMDGKNVFVIFFKPKEYTVSGNTLSVYTYAVCRQEGISTENSGNNVLLDKYNDLSILKPDGGLPGVVVVNLSNMRTSAVHRVYQTSPPDSPWIVDMYDSMGWAPNQEYGWILSEPKHLPKGFSFKPPVDSGTYNVVFKPDGTSNIMQGGFIVQSSHEFEIKEDINPTYVPKVSVNFDGFVDVAFPST